MSLRARSLVEPRAAAPGFAAWMDAQLCAVEQALEAWVPADAPA